jgi:aminoglycoside phosphotransferase (APT) family kinase protein
MTSAPDVVATAEEAAELTLPPLLVTSVVEGFLDDAGIGQGPVTAERIGDGQSNVTFLLRRSDRSIVLRRGPRPPHPASTHDMIREAGIQRMLGAAGVPVPHILATCEDDSLLGVPFYLMEFVPGTVVTDRIPPRLAGPDAARGIAFAAVDALIDLHRVDVTTPPLSSIGRPDGYLRRQVSRFTALWPQNTRRALPRVERLGAWLAERIPQSQAATVVHGDYRIGNLMLRDGGRPQVAAILDWEMATLGDPLADLGYFVATYSTRGSRTTPMDLSPVTREPGFPAPEELVARYRAAMPLDLGELRWYQALALWKAAIFCEAMYTRWLDGERPGDTFAPTLEAGIPALIDAAFDAVGLQERA